MDEASLTNDEREFGGAIRAANVEQTLKLISAGSDVNSTKLRPLSIAARYGDSRMVDLLLKHGADPDTIDEFGRSAVYLSAERGDLSCVDLLLRAKANPDLDRNMKALMIAARGGHTKIVSLLVRYGAAVDSQTERSGYTALHFAALERRAEAARELLAAGATVGIENRDHMTPVDLVGDDVPMQLALTNHVK